MALNLKKKIAVRTALCFYVCLLCTENVLAQIIEKSDTIASDSHFIHKVGLDFRPEYIIPFNSFLQGANASQKDINHSFSAHLRYSFQYKPGSIIEKAFGRDIQQGVGVSCYSLGDTHELGDPVTAYLFQSARIAKITSSLTLNYEWNLGLSFGWKPYDQVNNSQNTIIGSKVNAYIFAGVFLNQRLSNEFDLVAGYSFTHFSNGNTTIPNAGLNTTGPRLGLVYNFNRREERPRQGSIADILDFRRHFSYDVLLFGSWKRTGVQVGESAFASPDSYGVFGFNFSAFYNFGYRFRAGLSLDGFYDHSAGVYAKDYIVPLNHDEPQAPPEFGTPSFGRQLALGISGRVEYVMPLFTIDLGLGRNFLAGTGSLQNFYQVLALKVDITRNAFLHIGYELKDFHKPNHLMLGLGFRLHNQRTIFR